MERTRNYCSFMLRMKQVRTDDLPTWVVSIQDTYSGQQQIFSNVDGLIQFLQAEFGSGPELGETAPSAVDGNQSVSMP